MGSRAEVLAELRKVAPPATQLRRARPERVAATGIHAVDEALAGGWPKGRLSELSGRRSSGRTALAVATLAAATRRGEAVALVDVDGMLDARDAARAGIDLGLLLWVRARDGATGVRAADLLLRAGGFGVVVLDVGEAAPRLPDAAWLRLGRAAEGANAALVLVGPRRLAGTFAAVTVETERARPRFGGIGPRSPRILEAVEGAVAVVRSKLGAPGAAARVAWTRW